MTTTVYREKRQGGKWKKEFKGLARNLITNEQHERIMRDLKILPKEINSHIRLTNMKLTV